MRINDNLIIRKLEFLPVGVLREPGAPTGTITIVGDLRKMGNAATVTWGCS